MVIYDRFVLEARTPRGKEWTLVQDEKDPLVDEILHSEDAKTRMIKGDEVYVGDYDGRGLYFRFSLYEEKLLW